MNENGRGREARHLGELSTLLWTGALFGLAACVALTLPISPAADADARSAPPPLIG